MFNDPVLRKRVRIYIVLFTRNVARRFWFSRNPLLFSRPDDYSGETVSVIFSFNLFSVREILDGLSIVIRVNDIAVNVDRDERNNGRGQYGDTSSG